MAYGYAEGARIVAGGYARIVYSRLITPVDPNLLHSHLLNPVNPSFA
jgi:hypothetical protein